jgi:hypothetical protein
LTVRAEGTRLVVTVRRVLFPLRGSGALLADHEHAAGVFLTVQNAGPGSYDGDAKDAVTLATSQGPAATPVFVPRGGCTTPEVDLLRMLPAGQTRSGCVGFAVPRGARPVQVRFTPHRHRARSRTWRVRR